MTVCPPHDYAGPEPCPYCRRDLWKRLAKRCWQGWGYASKLQGRTHAELERRTAWSNEQFALLEAEFNKYKDRISLLESQRDDNESAWQAEKQKRETAEAEVARLREAFDISSAAHAQAEAVLATERAAHEATERSRQEATDRALGIAAKLDETVRALEATKAERDGWVDRCDRLKRETKAAEARVAELKRELVAQELRHVRTREERTALDQARRLLERTPMPDPDGEGPTNEQLEKWADFINSMADLLFGSGLRAHPATPAATGAELQIVECTDTPRGRAREKEAKG